MTQITINAGDTLNALAAKHLGDSSKWRELANENDLDVLSSLNVGATINLPDIGAVIDKAQPVLEDVAEGLNRASSVLSTVAEKVPQLSGYAQQALSAVAEVNGVSGKATKILADVRGKAEGLRSYDGQSVQLIDWLLQ